MPQCDFREFKIFEIVDFYKVARQKRIIHLDINYEKFCFKTKIIGRIKDKL